MKTSSDYKDGELYNVRVTSIGSTEYEQLTALTRCRIARLMKRADEAINGGDPEGATIRRLWAYGMFMLWESIAMGCHTTSQYHKDHDDLEKLVKPFRLEE